MRVTTPSGGALGSSSEGGTIDVQRGGYAFLGSVVFLTFWMRYFLAGKNSYWLDELYSVERYVVQQGSMIEAIRDLAGTSIHPPLYQGLLYLWVQWFGDGETATRSLSNVYATLSVVVVHRLVARLFDGRLANATALAFALTYAVMYYGLETRSYAQTLMLSTVSSLALIAYLERYRSSGATTTWLARVWPPTLLCAANLGMMLTHYYNFFFWGAQALFAAGFVVLVGPRRKKVDNLVVVGTLYSLQLVLFLAIWGRVTLESYQRNTGRFTAESVSFTPLEMIRRVTEQSFSFGPVSTTIVLVVAAGALLWMARSNWDRRGEPEMRSRFDGVAYLLMVTIVPPLLAYTAFSLVQSERFVSRYMLYLVPGLTVLLALAARQLAAAAVELFRRLFGAPDGGRSRDHSLVLVLVLVTLLVIPDTMRATRAVKDDWRGTAQDIVAIVESNPDADYVVYEPAFRSTPVYDYYLSRYSDEVRVTATIRRLEENRGENFSFERTADTIEQHDFLIIPFVHHRTTNFPIALERLSETYSVHHWQIDSDNKGLVIFSVSDRG